MAVAAAAADDVADAAVAAEEPATDPAPSSPPPAPEPTIVVAAIAEMAAAAEAGRPTPAPAVVPAGGGPAVPGVTALAVRTGDPDGGAHAALPADLGHMMAALGQAPAARARPAETTGDAAPGVLYFAPATAPIDGPLGAIDDLLRGGFAGNGATEAGDIGVGVPLPRVNPLPTEQRFQVAALPPANMVTPNQTRRTDNVCTARLASLALTVTMLPPVQDGACGIATPVELDAIGRGRNEVTLTPDAMVDCNVATVLTDWLENDVQAAARRYLGQTVTGIRVAAAYACRGRNNDPTAQLSEHAFGRAIDISAFQLADGTWLPVTPYNTGADAEPTEDFLAQIRADACGPFTTVLGPGVALHDDHFHLDLAPRSAYCR